MSESGMLFPCPVVRPPMPTQILRGAHLDGAFRYTLTRAWRSGPPCCWIMLNPSTADASQDDPTVRRCMAFAHGWGHPGIVIVNLFPFRSPSPAECKGWWLAQNYDDEMARNARIVVREIEAAAQVVVAWGSHGEWARAAAAFLEDEIASLDHPPPLWALGRTADGSPIHPMARGRHRVPDGAVLQPWMPRP